jgi:rare lipoprotein A
MPPFFRDILLFGVGVITIGCGARQSEGSGAITPGTEIRVVAQRDGAGDAVAFDELFALAEGASVVARFTGQASYYADSLSGNRMASGERYESTKPVAAHRTLPFGTLLRVIRISDGKMLVLRVADRGPHGSKQRVLDVSRAAAERLGMVRAGVVDVRVEVLAVSQTKK